MKKTTFYNFLFENFKGLSGPEQLGALVDIGTWAEELHDKLLKNDYKVLKYYKKQENLL